MKINFFNYFLMYFRLKYFRFKNKSIEKYKSLRTVLIHIYIFLLQFYIVISHVVATYIISYALHMFFEAPWVSLTEFLSRRCKTHTFSSEMPQEGPMTEKPIKYSEKKRIANSKCVNTLEKGHY